MIYENVIKLKQLKDLDQEPLHPIRGRGYKAVKTYKRFWDLVPNHHRCSVIERAWGSFDIVWRISPEAANTQEHALYLCLKENSGDFKLPEKISKVVRYYIKHGRSALYKRDLNKALESWATIEANRKEHGANQAK